MSVVLASIIQLLLSVMLLEAGSGLLEIVVPIRAQAEGFGTVTIGLLGSAYYLGFISSCLTVPAVIRRVGYIRAFSGFASVIASVLLLHPIIVWDTAWIMMRFIVGFGFASLYIVVESWLNNQATNEIRGRIFAAYMVATWLALVVGKLLYGCWPPGSFEPFAVAGIFACLAVAPVAFTTMSAPQPALQTPLEIRRVLSFSPLGTVGSLGVGIANGTFWSLGPLYPQAHGLDTTGIGIFMAVTVIGGALTQWPLGKWSDRTDRRNVITVASLAAGVTGLILASMLHIGNRPVLFASALCFGASGLPLYGLFIAHAYDHAPREAFVEVSSTLLLIFGVGAVIGPMAATALISTTGTAGIFLFTGIIHLLLFLYTLFSIRRRKSVTEIEKAPFVVVQKTTPAAVPLDPRATMTMEEDAKDVPKA